MDVNVFSQIIIGVNVLVLYRVGDLQGNGVMGPRLLPVSCVVSFSFLDTLIFLMFFLCELQFLHHFFTMFSGVSAGVQSFRSDFVNL
jgi:hypothetical protein